MFGDEEEEEEEEGGYFRGSSESAEAECFTMRLQKKTKDLQQLTNTNKLVLGNVFCAQSARISRA